MKTNNHICIRKEGSKINICSICKKFMRNPSSKRNRTKAGIIEKSKITKYKVWLNIPVTIIVSAKNEVEAMKIAESKNIRSFTVLGKFVTFVYGEESKEAISKKYVLEMEHFGLGDK